MGDPTTEKVRYRPEALTRLMDRLTGLGDPGTLTIEDGRISFAGKREQLSGRIVAVDDKILSSSVNIGMSRSRQYKRWIEVSLESDGQAAKAYFRGRSHKRLKQALEAAIES